MNQDNWIVEIYYDWLKSECFTDPGERRVYDGVLRVLHDIPFYWTIWMDENRAGDALSYRQNDFLGGQRDLDSLDQHWLNLWAQATPSVLEVLLGMARRWSYYFEGQVAYYFGHMFLNLGLDKHPGKVLSTASADRVRQKVDNWMSRQFAKNGEGSPFPLKALPVVDMTKMDIWAQMNAYSAEHFQ